MTFVITQPCFGAKYLDCVDVCPTESIHKAEEMVYIDPGTCVDCGVCAESCPVRAPMPLDEVPAMWKEFIDINAELAGRRAS
jgi:ferredoxin